MPFVNQRIPIVHEDGSVVYLHAKFDFGTRVRLQEILDTIDLTTPVGQAKGALALLQQSIAGWEGPYFGGHPFTPEAVELFDPDDPFFTRVSEEATKRWKPKEDAPSPLPSTTAAEPSVPGSNGYPAALTIST